MKKILITGSSGFIGQYLACEFSKHYEVIGTDVGALSNNYLTKFYQCDIRDKETILRIFMENKIDIVIHTAASKSIPWCEANPIESEDINLNASNFLFEVSKENNIHFIFVSSDIVFSGDEPMYKIGSKKDPINNYGKYKDVFEEIIRNSPKVTICRTALVFGKIPENQFDLKRSMFEKSELVVQGFIVEHVVDRLQNNKKICLPKDEFCSPTSNHLLYLQMEKIASKQVYGIVHCCGSERISRYDFGLKIADYFKLDSNLVTPTVHTDPLRPIDVSLEYIESEKKLGFKYLNIDEMLKQLKGELE